jgi:hypothetical protein
MSLKITQVHISSKLFELPFLLLVLVCDVEEGPPKSKSAQSLLLLGFYSVFLGWLLEPKSKSKGLH